MKMSEQAESPLRIQPKLNRGIENKWGLHQELSNESNRAGFSHLKSASATSAQWRDIFVDTTAVDKILWDYQHLLSVISAKLSGVVGRNMSLYS